MPTNLAWLKAKNEDRSEAEGPAKSLGNVTAGKATEARDVPEHPLPEGKWMRSLSMAEKLKMLLPLAMRGAALDASFTREALLAELGPGARYINAKVLAIAFLLRSMTVLLHVFNSRSSSDIVFVDSEEAKRTFMAAPTTGVQPNYMDAVSDPTLRSSVLFLVTMGVHLRTRHLCGGDELSRRMAACTFKAFGFPNKPSGDSRCR